MSDLVAVRSPYQGKVIEKRVFFSGSGALVRGAGLCYDRIVASALSPDIAASVATVGSEIRDNCVALPATANRGNFAGVTSQSYSAVSGGQWIVIYEPGSVCQVQCDVATTINTGMITCMVNGDQGAFGLGGLAGRGSAIPFQTTLTASATSGPGPNVSSTDGSATFTLSTKNVLKTGLFANAVAGDILVVYGGGLAADGTVPVTPGRYTIATVTDANNGILSTSLGSAGATAVIACQVVRGTPTVLAKLMEGPAESGCVDFVGSIAAASAAALDINGYTYFCMGGVTIASDAVPTLAVQSVVGRQRGFQCLGTITTSAVKVTPASTTAIQRNGTSTLATIAFSAVSQNCILEWGGVKWSVQHLAGATQA